METRTRPVIFQSFENCLFNHCRQAVNHYVTPIFSRQQLCKLNSNPNKQNKSTSRDFVAHFIEVDFWKV